MTEPILRFGHIEDVLAAIHAVGPPGRAAFRAKLKNLPRVGLDLPSQRAGRTANYHPADLFKFSFATQLLEFGLMPAQATTIVGACWPAFVGQLFRARGDASAGKAQMRRYLVSEPSGMTYEPFFFRAAESGCLQAGTRAAIIDVSALLQQIEASIEPAGIDRAAWDAAMDREAEIIAREGTLKGIN